MYTKGWKAKAQNGNKQQQRKVEKEEIKLYCM